MNKKGQMTLGVIVITIMGLFAALALFGAIIDSQASLTDKTDVQNQSVDVSSAYIGDDEVNESINFTIYSQSDWKKSECPLTSVTLLNGANTSLADSTDYELYESEGVFSLINTTKTVPSTSLNTTKVTYTHCPDGYNTSSGARGVARMISLFAALAIAVFAGRHVFKQYS